MREDRGASRGLAVLIFSLKMLTMQPPPVTQTPSASPPLPACSPSKTHVQLLLRGRSTPTQLFFLTCGATSLTSSTQAGSPHRGHQLTHHQALLLAPLLIRSTRILVLKQSSGDTASHPSESRAWAVNSKLQSLKSTGDCLSSSMLLCRRLGQFTKQGSQPQLRISWSDPRTREPPLSTFALVHPPSWRD